MQLCTCGSTLPGGGWARDASQLHGLRDLHEKVKCPQDGHRPCRPGPHCPSLSVYLLLLSAQYVTIEQLSGILGSARANPVLAPPAPTPGCHPASYAPRAASPAGCLPPPALPLCSSSISAEVCVCAPPPSSSTLRSLWGTAAAGRYQGSWHPRGSSDGAKGGSRAPALSPLGCDPSSSWRAPGPASPPALLAGFAAALQC